MNSLNQKGFALASGLTALFVYLCCFLTMLILGKSGLIKLSNLLVHGVDFTSIIRTEIPILETLSGAALSFFIWGLAGYLLAMIYNRIN